MEVINGYYHSDTHDSHPNCTPKIITHIFSSPSGWWFGTMEWIMTFHSVGNGKSSQLTFSPSLFRGVGRYTTKPAMFVEVKKTPFSP